MSTVTHRITNGPDCFKLAISLLNGDNGHRTPVEFALRVEGDSISAREEMLIEKIEREDGSGYKFNLRCYQLKEHRSINMFYNVKDRTGFATMYGTGHD